MILTIFYNNENKTKQVIKLSHLFFLDERGYRITYGKLLDKCKSIAHDLTSGNYLSFDLDAQEYETRNREQEEIN